MQGLLPDDEKDSPLPSRAVTLKKKFLFEVNPDLISQPYIDLIKFTFVLVLILRG